MIRILHDLRCMHVAATIAILSSASFGIAATYNSAPSHVVVADARPTFAGAANLSDTEIESKFLGFGLGRNEFGRGQDFANSIGLAIYDRARGNMVRSYNLDRQFYLGSTTKLFTMVVLGKTFRNDQLIKYHDTIAYMLEHSMNVYASRWMLAAHQQLLGKSGGYAAAERAWQGNCYTDPVRSPEQKRAERAAATLFLERHQALYQKIDWSGSNLVDGAGCEGAMAEAGNSDNLSPRQYLTVLEELRRLNFGGSGAYEIMPKTANNGIPFEKKLSRAKAIDQGAIARKTGTIGGGVKNIVGYIPYKDDPYAFYFVLLIKTGKSPPGPNGGLEKGKEVIRGFIKWAAEDVRKAGATR